MTHQNITSQRTNHITHNNITNCKQHFVDNYKVTIVFVYVLDQERHIKQLTKKLEKTYEDICTETQKIPDALPGNTDYLNLLKFNIIHV